VRVLSDDNWTRRKRRVKIKLVEPAWYLPNGDLLRPKELLLPSLTLPLLAALTPKGTDVVIENDQLGEIDFDEKVSLVGITSYTHQIVRAYEIADEFRKKGVCVVMGGIHVSMEPKEALEHADTVIIGEAEETWPKFLSDLRQGMKRRTYEARTRPNLAGLPHPRFSLVDTSKYLSFRRKGIFRFLPTPLFPIQTGRGCPHSCGFCSVTLFFGSEYRSRPVPDVIDELKMLGAKSCFFSDDNIFAHPSRAKELFRSLVPLKIRWMSQGTIGAARDRELIRLARRSGCFALLVGLESISPESLASLGKTVNRVNEYEENLKVYRKEGISIIASMMFGLDGEEMRVFKDTYEFLIRSRVPYTGWKPLYPYPGTPLLQKLKDEDRLKDEKWWLNRELAGKFLDLKFKGISMEEEAFYHDFMYYYRRFYSFWNILTRVIFPLQKRLPFRIFFSSALRKRISTDVYLLAGRP